MKLSLPNKCLSGIVLSTLCLSMSSAYADTDPNSLPPFLQQVPLFTPYNLNAASYSIKGSIVLPGSPIAQPGIMVVDTQNRRLAYVFGAVGTFITTEAGSMNYGIRGGINCFTNSFTYTNYEKNYKNITSINGSTKEDIHYQGATKDSFSCDQDITFTFREQLLAGGSGIGVGQDRLPVITELYASLPTPVTPPGVTPRICVQGQAGFIADPTTVIFNTNNDPHLYDAYFQIPAAFQAVCAAPADYCKAVYPLGNACANPGTPL
jgi:hypothetical protein